jgi:hypothetical protein
MFSGSEFNVQVEITQTARIKGIESSSGYKSVSLNGVWRVYCEVGSGNAEVGHRPIGALDAYAPEGSGNRKAEFGIERFGRISDNYQQDPLVVTFEPLAQTRHGKIW